MDSILIIKTAALGDVLRTTSILPGLKERHPQAAITWLSAPGARDLVRTHPLLSAVETIDTKRADSIRAAEARLRVREWDWVISLDDEEPLCQLASSLRARQLSGAYTKDDGTRGYTRDVAPWFDMGLLSVYGKQRADELKVLNQESQPAIYARMLSIPMGRPQLVLPEHSRARARELAQSGGWHAHGPLIGLNTGAGGRWTSKQLSPERTVDLAGALARELRGRVRFLVLGGAAEEARNREIVRLAALHPCKPDCIDARNDHELLDFAALVGECGLLVTSDSLALHIAVSLARPLVAFFAPTSAAEIELYGLGEKVWSTAADYCSYQAEADNSSLSTERLGGAVLRVLNRAH
jgi:heptosyltransferase-2